MAYLSIHLHSVPVTNRSQITHLACEEGWSYIAEWIGTPLSHVLDAVGTLPQARYVVYRSIQDGWWESIDMADAVHPQTFITYGMNGTDLPVRSGGPLRLRIPRQLSYKSVVLKAMNREPARRYRLSRFAVRNRWGRAAALAVLLSLTAGTVVSVRQAIIARLRARSIARI